MSPQASLAFAACAIVAVLICAAEIQLDRLSDEMACLDARQATVAHRISVIDSRLHDEVAMQNEMLILGEALQPVHKVTPKRPVKRK